MIVYHRVAAIDSLPPGKGRTVVAAGRQFALFNMNGEFHAIDDLCPHRGASLGAGWAEDGRVYCPMHGWEFDLKTGGCVSNPEKPVRRYPTRVCDGEVEIGVETT